MKNPPALPRPCLAPTRRPGAAARRVGTCRGRAADPAPLQGERFARGFGLSDRDALLVAVAPALRGSWLLGPASLSALLDRRGEPGRGAAPAWSSCASHRCSRSGGGVRLRAGGRPVWEVTLAAPYSSLRLLLLRARVRDPGGPARSPSSPRRSSPDLLDGGRLAASGPRLRRHLPCPLHLDPRPARGRSPWVGRRRRLCRWTRSGSFRARALGTGPAALPRRRLVASAAFWVRSDRLSFLGRTS